MPTTRNPQLSEPDRTKNRDDLIVDHLWLCHVIARDWTIPHHDREDIEAEARVALVEAADRYDHVRPFLPWAGRIIRQRLGRVLQRERRLKRCPTHRPLSLDAPVTDGSSTVLVDLVAQTTFPSPSEALEEGQRKERVNQLLAALPPIEAEVIRRRAAGAARRAIGESLDLSPWRIVTVERRAVERFRVIWADSALCESDNMEMRCLRSVQ